MRKCIISIHPDGATTEHWGKILRDLQNPNSTEALWLVVYEDGPNGYVERNRVHIGLANRVTYDDYWAAYDKLML